MALIIQLIAGFLVGILINYLADVLPIFHELSKPCDNCERPYSIKTDLISLKCPSCGKKKSPRFIVVLISAVLISGLLHFFPFHALGFWAALPIMAYLGLVAVVDIEHRVVLGETTLFGFALFLAYGIVLHSWKQTLVGGLGGFLIMLIFYFLGIVFSKIVGKIRKREISEVAFGFGDVTTCAILGLFTGWPVVIGAIILGFVTFAIYSIVLLLVLILTKKYAAFTNALPFTPFLILGMIIIYYL